MGALVQQHSTTGGAANSKTETFSPCVAGNLMVICAATNENVSPDDINTPSGWTLLHTYRQGTITANLAVFGKISAGGETSQVVTSTVAAQRLQTWFGEFSGVSLTVGGTSTNGIAGAGATSGSTGSIGGVVATDLYIGLIAVKQVVTITGTAAYTLATVNNEGGAASTQKITVQVKYDTTPPAPSQVNFTWATTSQYAALGVWLVAASSGTLYTKGVSGALSFAGIRPKAAASRKVTGAVSFSGTRTLSPTARTVTGVFAPTGALTPNQSLFRTLTAAALTFTVSLKRGNARSLSGALSFVGVRTSIKSVSQNVSGALSFVGAQTQQARKLLTADLTATGDLQMMQALNRLLTAAFQPVSTLKRSTSRLLSGALSLIVTTFTATSRPPFTATFRPTGTQSHGLPARTLYAALTFSSSMPRFITRQLVASLQAAAVMNTHYLPPVGPTPPGGGGFGALMADSHFQRYQVAEKWRHMKRVKA